MDLKIVFLLAMIALSYGLPTTESSQKFSTDLQDIQKPEIIDGHVQQLLAGNIGEATLTEKVDETSSLKQRREACRTVQVRTKSGRTISVSKC